LLTRSIHYYTSPAFRLKIVFEQRTHDTHPLKLFNNVKHTLNYFITQQFIHALLVTDKGYEHFRDFWHNLSLDFFIGDNYNSEQEYKETSEKKKKKRHVRSMFY